MIGLLLRRACWALFALWFLVSLAFLLLHWLPGDPARALLGPHAPEHAVQALRENMGFDQPLHRQYGHHLARLLAFDLGTSLRTQAPVSEVIARKAWATVGIAGLAWAGGVGLGAGLLIGDCSGVASLLPDPRFGGDRWEQGLNDGSFRWLVRELGGCVNAIEPVAHDEAVVSAFGGSDGGRLIAVRFQPPATGSGEPTPDSGGWQPPG